MRDLAAIGLLCLLAGCASLPAGVKVNLQERVIEVGPCRCAVPAAKGPGPEGGDAQPG